MNTNNNVHQDNSYVGRNSPPAKRTHYSGSPVSASEMGNGYNLESILKSWDGTSNVSYGSGEIAHQQLALMRVLSELSQGWWFWDEDKDTVVIFQSYTYRGIA
ncbi:hypothetical protein NIES25_67450 (plasmid) [Nostoc linckia NIES-25]|nr:hypothetical protein NIES22_36630 [Calothrix brevissima NIES-22]BAY80257.1 hypothetical protein NIES25_67450 [Nostoc linckia NIES-25]